MVYCILCVNYTLQVGFNKMGVHCTFILINLRETHHYNVGDEPLECWRNAPLECWRNAPLECWNVFNVKPDILTTPPNVLHRTTEC